MENLTGGTPPVRYLPCVVPCKLYFRSVATKPNAKAIINKCAIETVLSTKDKRLNRFEGFRKGFPDGYICLKPKDNYRRIVSSQEEKEKAEKDNTGAFKKKLNKTVYDPFDDELDDDYGV